MFKGKLILNGKSAKKREGPFVLSSLRLEGMVYLPWSRVGCLMSAIPKATSRVSQSQPTMKAVRISTTCATFFMISYLNS